MRHHRLSAVYLFLLFLLAGCHSNPLKVNTRGIDIDLKVNRLDQDLSAVTESNCSSAVAGLQKKYGTFFEVYNKEVLAIGDSRDSLYNGYLLTFLRDSIYLNAKQRADSVFRNFKPYVSQLEEAFKHYKYYYPEEGVPELCTYISGYNQSVLTTSKAIGIGLDNYLGAGCPYYRLLGIYEYKRRNMEPEKLVYDVMYAWAFHQYEFKGNHENLVSNMIYQGKLVYFVDAMLPEGPDSLKMGYSEKQLGWCRENEPAMWSFLIERKALFSSDRMEIVRFINSAPFTTPFGQQSPGRTGVWIGWQIVKSYMKKHPGTTLRKLMEDNDYHRILNESGYAPL